MQQQYPIIIVSAARSLTVMQFMAATFGENELSVKAVGIDSQQATNLR